MLTITFFISFAVLFGTTFGDRAITTTINSHPTTTTSSPVHHNETETEKGPLHLNFTARLTRLNHPFPISCIISGAFAGHERANYSVVFYRTADTAKHLIGRFDAFGKFC